MDAVLQNLYLDYERQFRDLGLQDHETLLGRARYYVPALPETASKGDCANIIMEYSRLGLRIAELEKEEQRSGNAMIAVAYFLVWEHGMDNLPYFHRHVWITENINHAIVELVDYRRETEKAHHLTMRCFDWHLKERADIGV